MNYIKNVVKTGTISLGEIGFSPTAETAEEMKKEIISFFEENSNGELIFDFGGKSRLSATFVVKLFEDKAIKQYHPQMRTSNINSYDKIKMQGMLEEV